MECHHFLLVTYDGEILEGTDTYPPESAKANAKEFILDIFGSNSNVVFFIPKGNKLIFKRRVRIDVVCNTDVLATGEGGVAWHYIVGYEPLEV